MIKLVKQFHLLAIFASLIIGVGYILLSHGYVNASQSVVSCSSLSSSAFYDVLDKPISGSIYVRLPAGSSSSSLSLYSADATESNCQLIGAVTASSSKWVYLGNSSAFTNLVMFGQQLSAEPYAAVAQLLALPQTNLCSVNTSCTINYQGFSASLTPNLISNNTDQIAVYLAQSIDNIAYKNINYFSDGILLYSSDKLSSFNRNYLSGGTHQITIQVNFVNDEKVIINQTVNMGADWSGVLKIRSDFYNSHSKLLFGGVVIGFVMIIAIGLSIIRAIYKKHEFKIEHGLTHYKDSQYHDDDSDDNNPVVG